MTKAIIFFGRPKAQWVIQHKQEARRSVFLQARCFAANITISTNWPSRKRWIQDITEKCHEYHARVNYLLSSLPDGTNNLTSFLTLHHNFLFMLHQLPHQVTFSQSPGIHYQTLQNPRSHSYRQWE